MVGYVEPPNPNSNSNSNANDNNNNKAGKEAKIEEYVANPLQIRIPAKGTSLYTNYGFVKAFVLLRLFYLLDE